jgi:LacI family transcriptional regulator
MTKRATIYTVAETAGVSIATVSRVMNGQFHGDEQIRQKVLAAMEQVSYRPNHEARRLMGKSARTKMVGIMAPFFVHPFFTEVLKGAYRVIHSSGHSILLYDVDTKTMKKQIIKRVVDEDILDGLLMVNMRLDEREYAAITRRIPLVLVAAETEFADCVIVDNYKAIVRGLHHIHALGHRNVAFINNAKDIYESRIREKAFREESERLGIHYKIDYRNVDRPSGYIGAKAIVDNWPDVTCLFYYSDLMAYGGLDFVSENRLGSILSVMGFDGFETALHLQLTTVVQPMELMGESGARMLQDKIEGRQIERRRIVLDSWLEEGKTCKGVTT